jgi:hypothetical protein
MGKLIGMGGDVEFGSITQHVSKSELSFEGDTPDVMDTGSAGWQELISGNRKAELSFTCFVNTTTLVANAAAFQPGELATGIFNIGSSGKAYECDFMIKSNRITNSCKDPVELEVTASSTGALILPV